MKILIAVVLSCACLAAPARAGDVAVGWKEKEYTTAKLPLGLSAPALDAIVRWRGFAEKAGYRMDLDAQGRLLLVTRGKDAPREKLRLVGWAETWFDATLPPPARTATPAASEPGGGADPAEKPAEKPARPAPEPLPEDPESPPPGAPKPPPARGTTGVPASPARAYGSGSIAPDSQTAVLIVLHDEQDHALLLDQLEASVGYLKDWIATARTQTGLTLEDPLLGAYCENASGQEEWNGDHELVNRAVQLLVLRRFGQQPNWVVQGLAWEAEMALDGSVYCFPYRDGFVFATEHTSWPSDLANAFEKRAGRPLAIAELTAWPRGTWDGEKAPLAWGFVHHLVAVQKETAQKGGEPLLTHVLEEWRVARDGLDREPTGATTWRRQKDFRLPDAVQEAALQKRYGKDVFKKATLALRAGVASSGRTQARSPR